MPDLPWEEACTEDASFHALYTDDFGLSIPQGVDFVSANENVHFSSLMLFHPVSSTIHVDDTLIYVRLPMAMRWLGIADLMVFHPTLGNALEKRAGAAREFLEWAESLPKDWSTAGNFCAAHTAPLMAQDNRGASIPHRM